MQPHPSASRGADAVSESLDLLMPLHFFYASQGMEMPAIRFISGEEMPSPYHSLLVHEADMTPRLRAFHGAPITLEVLQREHAADYLMRAVVLHRSDSNAPVEFGAIGIRLDAFDGDTRRRVAACVEPLGGILEDSGFPHSSHPRGYFCVCADTYIAQALDCQPGDWLYGRCNELRGADTLTFADIVEILPPAGDAG